MVGLIRCSQTAGLLPRRPRLSKLRICGILFWELEIFLPKNPKRKRAAERAMKRGAKKLRSVHVSRYVKPAGAFSWETLLAEQGLFPVNQSRLFTAMAVPLTLRLLEEEGQSPNGAVVALCGQRTGPLFEKIALSLCAKVRNLAIHALGSDNLCWQLRREYGVPVLEGGAGISRAAVTLLFSPLPPERKEEMGKSPILYLGSEPPGELFDRRLVRQARFAVEGETLPESWDSSDLVTTLYEQGKIGLSQIEIEQLS